MFIISMRRARTLLTMTPTLTLTLCFGRQECVTFLTSMRRARARLEVLTGAPRDDSNDAAAALAAALIDAFKYTDGVNTSSEHKQ